MAMTITEAASAQRLIRVVLRETTAAEELPELRFLADRSCAVLGAGLTGPEVEKRATRLGQRRDLSTARPCRPSPRRAGGGRALMSVPDLMIFLSGFCFGLGVLLLARLAWEAMRR